MDFIHIVSIDIHSSIFYEFFHVVIIVKIYLEIEIGAKKKYKWNISLAIFFEKFTSNNCTSTDYLLFNDNSKIFHSILSVRGM